MSKFLLALAVLAASALPCAASAAEEVWDLGADYGQFYPLRNGQYLHDVPNVKVLELLQSETVLDETNEGFVAPPLTGQSRITGTIKPTPDVGGHVYRRVLDHFWLGMEGGYAMQRSLWIDSRGIWDRIGSSKFLSVDYEGHAMHFNAMAKYGKWLGRVRPVFALGPGVYTFREILKVEFKDVDDPQIKPLRVVDKVTAYSGIAGHAGVDIRVTKNGTLSLGCQYHKVLSPGNKLDFLLPRAQFSVLFGNDWFAP